MCQIVHIAELPDDVAEAIITELRDDDGFDTCDSLDLSFDDWEDDVYEPIMGMTDVRLTIIDRSRAVDNRHRETPPTQVV